MEIPIFDTSEREQVIEVTGSAEEMDIQSEDFSLRDDVRVACTLHRTGDLVRVEGTATAALTAQCARCLEPSGIEVSGPFSFVIRRMTVGEVVTEDEAAADGDEEEFISVEHTVTSVDITGFVRDAIILALPIRVLCREDCKGLCVVCGNNRNESDCGCESGDADPRWRALNEVISENREMK